MVMQDGCGGVLAFVVVGGVDSVGGGVVSVLGKTVGRGWMGFLVFVETVGWGRTVGEGTG